MKPMKRFLTLLLALLMMAPAALAADWHGTAEELADLLTEAGYILPALAVESENRVVFTGGAMEIFASAEACAAAETDSDAVIFRQDNVLLTRQPSWITSHYEAALTAILTGESIPAYDAQDVRRERALETTVWIPTNGGKKYHSKSSCSNMKNPVQVTVREAVSSGFEACKRCKPVVP